MILNDVGLVLEPDELSADPVGLFTLAAALLELQDDDPLRAPPGPLRPAEPAWLP